MLSAARHSPLLLLYFLFLWCLPSDRLILDKTHLLEAQQPIKNDNLWPWHSLPHKQDSSQFLLFFLLLLRNIHLKYTILSQTQDHLHKEMNYSSTIQGPHIHALDNQIRATFRFAVRGKFPGLLGCRKLHVNIASWPSPVFLYLRLLQNCLGLDYSLSGLSLTSLFCAMIKVFHMIWTSWSLGSSQRTAFDWSQPRLNVRCGHIL